MYLRGVGFYMSGDPWYMYMYDRSLPTGENFIRYYVYVYLTIILVASGTGSGCW